jgi:S-adenosylmethionine decarboxylase proenzyme
MHGLHITADLFDCADPQGLLADAGALQWRCEAQVRAAGLTVVGTHFHAFAGGGGVTGVVLLAESHLALHTWPEHASVTLDAYVCNFRRDNSAQAEALVAALVKGFGPGRVSLQRLHRGVPASTASATGANMIPGDNRAS